MNMNSRHKLPVYLKEALVRELFSASLDMERAADELQEGAEVECVETLIHTLTQRMSLLDTAAICLQSGNHDHADRILEYVGEHKMKTSARMRRAVVADTGYAAVNRRINNRQMELCVAGAQTE